MSNGPPIFGEPEMISAVSARRWIHESALMVRQPMLHVNFFTYTLCKCCCTKK
jgi:hypothetical protein